MKKLITIALLLSSFGAMAQTNELKSSTLTYLDTTRHEWYGEVSKQVIHQSTPLYTIGQIEVREGLIGCPVVIGTNSGKITFEFNNDYIAIDKSVITDSAKVIHALVQYIRKSRENNRDNIDYYADEIARQQRLLKAYKNAYEALLRDRREFKSRMIKEIKRIVNDPKTLK